MNHGPGQTQPIRPGDVYPASAADQEARRERDSVIERGDDHGSNDGGLAVTETDLSTGKRLVTTTAGGQVMAQFTVPVPDREVAEATDAVTVGEALEAAAMTSEGDKPVGLAHAAVVQAAEMRATGLPGVIPGGVAASAQKAAEANKRPAAEVEGEKVRLRDVVGHAVAVLPANKVVTREDSEKVAAAAERNTGKGEAEGGQGVAAAVAAAAEMNERRMT